MKKQLIFLVLILSISEFAMSQKLITFKTKIFVKRSLSILVLLLLASLAEAQVTINVETAGTLSTVVTDLTDPTTVTSLTITGTIDARDVKFMRDDMTTLEDVDLSAVAIAEYDGTEGTAGSDPTTYPTNTMPNYSFNNKTTLTNITLPLSITTIGEEAFGSCTGLTSTTIPSSLTSIDSYAFHNCTNLTSITIPASASNISSLSFVSCAKLTSIDVNASNSNYSNIGGVLFNKEKTTLICYPGIIGNYTIPASVSSIGDFAFYLCTGLTSLTIHGDVTTIGYGVFEDCSSLTSFIVAASNIYYISLGGVLFNKDKTTLICYPGGAIGNYTIPSSVTTLGQQAFWGCTHLTSINIPASVKSIQDWVFQNCTGITTITIPNSIASIGSYAFFNCTNLTSIYALPTTPVVLTLSDGVFIGINTSTCILYVPGGSESAYSAAVQWEDFNYIVGIYPTLVSYVTQTGAGLKTGVSWDDAYDNTQLQTAINETSVTEVWVAAGTYKPTTTTNRTISFNMKNHVTIYGGFTGTETTLSQRNWSTHPTILSGDIGTPGISDNSYHVINNSGINNTAVLNGFTIQGGNGSSGGGVNNSSSSPTLANCTISGNYVELVGGGVSNYQSSPTLTNCIISGNSATGYGLTPGWGGGIYNSDNSNPTLTNCTISGNNSGYGGGIANYELCSPIIYNSIIWGNLGYPGNQIYNYLSATSLYSTCYANGTGDVVFGDGSTVTPDANCINTNPLFVNATGGDYRIFGNSPCVNTGNSSYNTELLDIRGKARIQGTNIDMGAYEWTSGTDPSGNLFTWTGNSSTDWNTPENWNSATVPSGTDAATIPYVTTHFPEVSNAATSPALCYNLEVGSGSFLTVKTNGALTVNGILQNDNVSGVSNIVVESGGSLITNSNPAATVKRTINGWTDANHGWHLLSSPVSTQSISSEFTDGVPENYDFYAWWELTNEWVNYKNSTTAPDWNTANVLGSTNGAGNFIPGKGYLVAYSTNSTKQFTGNLNNVKIQISGLAKSTGINRGWHLLGNPFPSALKWNDGNWALSQITGTAKIWKESVASYVDIATNGIIPAANGFMVETSGNGSLTIPLASRTHDATAFYKSTETAIKLVAHDTQNQTAQESIIKINNQATEYFNPEYDSHFLPGYAPQFYSVKDNENLSTNCLPTLFNLEIPMGFVKNDAHSFTIELDAGSMAPGQAVYLTDKKTGTITKLSTNPLYNFTSDEGDDVNRFILKFGTLGINDPAETGPLPVILQQDGRLYLQNIEKYNQIMVYDMQGRILQTNVLNEDASQNIGFNQPAGVYIVRLSNHNSFINTKIIVY